MSQESCICNKGIYKQVHFLDILHPRQALIGLVSVYVLKYTEENIYLVFLASKPCLDSKAKTLTEVVSNKLMMSDLMWALGVGCRGIRSNLSPSHEHSWSLMTHVDLMDFFYLASKYFLQNCVIKRQYLIKCTAVICILRIIWVLRSSLQGDPEGSN